MEECSPSKRDVGGSNPSESTICLCSLIGKIQRYERLGLWVRILPGVQKLLILENKFTISVVIVLLAIINVWACFTNFYDKTTCGLISFVVVVFAILNNLKK